MAKPVFIAVSGLPGTGKSYFSAKLAERLPLMVLESDHLRKILFPAPDYSAAESARLFQTINHLIERLLKRGISLVLDATNLSERYRERLYSIADHIGVKLILVLLEAAPELVQQRLSQPAPDSRSSSEAGWDVYQRMKPSIDKISSKHYVVNTAETSQRC
jgi:predicted kinase